MPRPSTAAFFSVPVFNGFPDILFIPFVSINRFTFLCIPCSYRLSIRICKTQSGFQWKCCPFCPPIVLHKLRLFDCSFVAPFLQKETELLTILLYRQQPRKSMLSLENLTTRFPPPAACRRICGTRHKAAVPTPGALPFPAPAWIPERDFPAWFLFLERSRPLFLFYIWYRL